MARIAGVDLPRNKQARIALTYIFGIGNPRSLKILEKANVDAFKKIQDLGEEEVNRIRQVIEDEGDVEGDLRKDVQMHIKRLIDIQSYRGSRHRRSLPVRGQRTHTNARTARGPVRAQLQARRKRRRRPNGETRSEGRSRQGWQEQKVQEARAQECAVWH